MCPTRHQIDERFSRPQAAEGRGPPFVHAIIPAEMRMRIEAFSFGSIP
jgi:hypothetical protein